MAEWDGGCHYQFRETDTNIVIKKNAPQIYCSLYHKLVSDINPRQCDIMRNPRGYDPNACIHCNYAYIPLKHVNNVVKEPHGMDKQKSPISRFDDIM